ncbi:MAG: hypothetical protein ACYS21_14885 [Planctomycetota bacterium]
MSEAGVLAGRNAGRMYICTSLAGSWARPSSSTRPTTSSMPSTNYMEMS